MTERSVVALTSKRPQCGKSSFAKVLEGDEFGYVRIGVADPMRKMLATFGLSDDEITGSLKDVPNDKLAGTTPRRMLQVLGREVPDALGRPELWGELWYKAAVETEGNIVVDDHRYPYERKYFEKYAGRDRPVNVVRINRAGGEEIQGATHAAEQQTLSAEYTINNDGSLIDLKVAVLNVMENIDRVRKLLSGGRGASRLGASQPQRRSAPHNHGRFV
jgi:hypothetical protein